MKTPNAIFFILHPSSLILFFLLASCSPVPKLDPANPVTIELALPTNSIHIGDAVTATVRITHPTGMTIPLSSPEDGKNIVPRNQERRVENLAHALERTTYRYDLTSFRIGTHRLWTQSFDCVSSDGRTFQVAMPDARIEVQSILSSPPEPMRDIKPPLRWSSRPRWLIIVVLTLVFLIILVALYLLRKRRAAASLPAAPPPPPHVIALRALDELLARGHIEAGRVEPFYVELSSIIRTYLENRFQLRAPEQTTEEFIHDAVNARCLAPAHQQALRDFLEQSDLVKFARLQPGPGDMRLAHETGCRFVRETQPEQPTEAAP